MIFRANIHRKYFRNWSLDMKKQPNKFWNLNSKVIFKSLPQIFSLNFLRNQNLWKNKLDGDSSFSLTVCARLYFETKFCISYVVSVDQKLIFLQFKIFLHFITSIFLPFPHPHSICTTNSRKKNRKKIDQITSISQIILQIMILYPRYRFNQC